MEVTINGQKEKIEESAISVARLLDLKQVESPDMVSVQLNGSIIDRKRYDKELLSAGDEIEFLYFMGGGGGR